MWKVVLINTNSFFVPIAGRENGTFENLKKKKKHIITACNIK